MTAAAAAVAAIPDLLPPDPKLRRKAFDVIRHVLSARGEIEGEVANRLQRVARLFGVDVGSPGVTALPVVRKTGRAKAS